MALNYRNLDESTRSQMVEEIDRDIEGGTLYISPRLNDEGVQQWPSILKEAARFHDDAWLADNLLELRILRSHEERKKPKGGTTIAKIPVTANETLAEGEFNRFYARGVCQRAIKEKKGAVLVYRARHSNNPRSESVVMEGKFFDPNVLLNDIRSSPGVETALGMPPGPNSGLSIALP
ncbi:hypothetical protein [Vreelandella sulfidaeris]